MKINRKLTKEERSKIDFEHIIEGVEEMLCEDANDLIRNSGDMDNMMSIENLSDDLRQYKTTLNKIEVTGTPKRAMKVVRKHFPRNRIAYHLGRNLQNI